MPRPRILISNDDGFYGQGLKPLIKYLRTCAEVIAIVPDGERSAASHSITLHKPFRIQTFPVEIKKNEIEHITITNGTPSDCVRFGVLEVLKNKRVDLVVGGINRGPNLGEDTVYSGTVAVAREGTMLGIPSFAVSVVNSSDHDFEIAAQASLKIAKKILKHKLPPRVFLNVNVPSLTNGKIPMQITRLGKRIYGKEIPSGIDPRGQAFYWLAGVVPQGVPETGTDISAIKSNKISITPMTIDSTCVSFLKELKGWDF